MIVQKPKAEARRRRVRQQPEGLIDLWLFRNRKRKHGGEGSGSRREADEDGVSYTRDNKDHKKDARRDEKFDKYGRDKDKDKDKEAPKERNMLPFVFL